jgi:hypothetical protein
MGEVMEQSASIGQVPWWFSHNLPPASLKSLVFVNYVSRGGTGSGSICSKRPSPAFLVSYCLNLREAASQLQCP